MARSVFFPFIVEAAEIFVQFEAKVFKKIKGTFHKNKTECRNFETACRKVLMFFCVRVGRGSGDGRVVELALVALGGYLRTISERELGS